MPEIDWGLMACDLSNLFDNFSADYDLDLCRESIEPNLPAFIAACQAAQRELDAEETEQG